MKYDNAIAELMAKGETTFAVTHTLTLAERRYYLKSGFELLQHAGTGATVLRWKPVVLLLQLVAYMRTLPEDTIITFPRGGSLLNTGYGGAALPEGTPATVGFFVKWYEWSLTPGIAFHIEGQGVVVGYEYDAAKRSLLLCVS